MPQKDFPGPSFLGSALGTVGLPPTFFYWLGSPFFHCNQPVTSVSNSVLVQEYQVDRVELTAVA